MEAEQLKGYAQVKQHKKGDAEDAVNMLNR